ncbi:MAG: hypothetical protein ABJL72_04665 [Roseobacter sp.]
MPLEMYAPHVNFHIGAPRIAANVLKVVSGFKKRGKNNSFLILKGGEYRQHLRSFVNGSYEQDGYFGAHETGEEDHWQRWKSFEVLAGSQHAMMGRPKDVFQLHAILPEAEQRIARLSNFFSNCTLDLHLAITDQGTYLQSIPSDYLTQLQSQTQACSVPSWAELVARISQSCPNRTLYVWDFSRPAFVALPFAVAMVNGSEDLTDELRKPIAEALVENARAPEDVSPSALDQDMFDVFREQYEYDLDSIDSIESTVLIRSSNIPEELQVAVGYSSHGS